MTFQEDRAYRPASRGWCHVTQGPGRKGSRENSPPCPPEALCVFGTILLFEPAQARFGKGSGSTRFSPAFRAGANAGRKRKLHFPGSTARFPHTLPDWAAETFLKKELGYIYRFYKKSFLALSGPILKISHIPLLCHELPVSLNFLLANQRWRNVVVSPLPRLLGIFPNMELILLGGDGGFCLSSFPLGSLMGSLKKDWINTDLFLYHVAFPFLFFLA